MSTVQSAMDRQCELEMEGYLEGIQRYENVRSETLRDKNRDNLMLTPEAKLLREAMGHPPWKLSKIAAKPTRGKPILVISESFQ